MCPQCRDAEAQRDKADRKLRHAQLAVAEICGRARNSYSKGVLKKDFKDGLLEMEETAADVELDARAASSGAAHCSTCYVSCHAVHIFPLHVCIRCVSNDKQVMVCNGLAFISSQRKYMFWVKRNNNPLQVMIEHFSDISTGIIQSASSLAAIAIQAADSF